MIKLFYLLSEQLTQQYTETKTELSNAKKGMTPSEIKTAKEEIKKECQIYDFDPDSPEELYSVNDGVANIPIAGMLVNKPDICAVFFGETVTTYKFIREATIRAENDPSVETILYNVNSGGGYVTECEETYQVMAGCKKHKVAAVHDMSASAAYWLSSACDEIVSVSKTGFFGSIGVAVEVVNRDKADEQSGIKRVVLTNNESKKKRPNMATDEGQKVMIDELNAIYSVFKSSILAGRGNKLTSESIDNLEGRVLIAEDAIKYGLVDSYVKAEDLQGYLSGSKNKISVSVENNKSTPIQGKTEETMNLNEFLAQNPEAKKEFDTQYNKGVEAGKAEMQKRIDATANYIGNENYPGIEALAKRVLTGESEIAALEGAIFAYDMSEQKKASKAAAEETEKVGDTPPNSDLNKDAVENAKAQEDLKNIARFA